MKKYSIFLLVAILILSSVACSVSVNLPQSNVGPTETWSANQPVENPDGQHSVTIKIGAGTLNVSGGSEGLVEGDVQYNISDWKPQLVANQDDVTIQQSNIDTLHISTKNVVNDWIFKLGSVPMDLNIQAGAYQGTLDLGGLSLENLYISDGASQAKVRFDEPNLVAMQTLEYKTGASEISLYGLANSRAANVSFDGGAGSYTLDFSGDLTADMNVIAKVGVCNLKIYIPVGTASEITITGGLNNVQPTGSWNISNNVYTTQGSGPTIYVTLDMGLGNLDLVSQ